MYSFKIKPIHSNPGSEESFYTDHALEPKPQVLGMKQKEYLHQIFEFVKTDNNPLSTANYNFIYDNVARYWLSAVFGFFKHEGMIVQVNPAYLYALSFFRAKRYAEGIQ